MTDLILMGKPSEDHIPGRQKEPDRNHMGSPILCRNHRTYIGRDHLEVYRRPEESVRRTTIHPIPKGMDFLARHA